MASVNRSSSVKVEQRALQRDRERKIVLRQQQRVGEIHQIDDRDVFGQFQPVGAGDGNAGVLQRLDDGVEQVAAAAHQHQHVAIAKRRRLPSWPVMVPPATSRLISVWMRFDSLTSGLVTGTPSNGARQPSMSCARRRSDKLPELDLAWTGIASASCADAFRRRGCSVDRSSRNT